MDNIGDVSSLNYEKKCKVNDFNHVEKEDWEPLKELVKSML